MALEFEIYILYYTVHINTMALGTFSCLEVISEFKRRLGYYIIHIYVPTCLIVIISFISFWMHPEEFSARVILGVISLLSLTLQDANVQKFLPPFPYFKAIDVYVSGCIIFVFLSLVECCLVKIITGNIDEKKKPMESQT